MRKEQIKRRLTYQYNKTHAPKTKFKVGSSDPMAVLTAKLTGNLNAVHKPRQKTAYNIWGPMNRYFVDPIFNERPSTAPGDRQRVIESLGQIMQPILDLVADHTGWKVSMIAGGPEPADGGRLNVVGVHSGVTTGSVRMNFGRSERVAYKDLIMPTFARFLRKCYTLTTSDKARKTYTSSSLVLVRRLPPLPVKLWPPP
ncbi:hypothetical protein HYPSUDRAFT_210178 [Hypholoma sublateritium FD-334 SS-4]|uniref:Uncharacterized protein n=1 Tax=Hypholoma sublateritium (strain FD-334 SS-4) TaxID=945553 RepID=A0A0D2N0N4_HYPSF|nr:hypothetical protein HYPSUDRAFT_210178 [Hypholoma sublateritium FD-334 SS-4]